MANMGEDKRVTEEQAVALVRKHDLRTVATVDRWYGRCPKCKSGGLKFSDRKQVWYCFSCKSGGNVIRFVMYSRGCDFTKACEILEKMEATWTSPAKS